MIRTVASCTRSCRWCSIRAHVAGAIRPSSVTCFPRPRGPCRGCRGSLTSSWTRRLSIPTRLPAAFGRHVDMALQMTAQLILSPSQARGGVDELRRFVLYVMATQEHEEIETFGEALRRQGLEQGVEIMTYAEELLAQGRAEAQVEVVEGFLRVGVAWDVIEAATGLTETKFQELKEQLSDSGS